MSDKKVKFRQSISGFNREDVNNYISDMTAKHLKETQEDKKTIAQLEEKLKKLENELEECREEYEKEKENAENQRISDLTALNEKLTAENEKLTAENSELNNKVTEFIKVQEKTEALWEKSSKYDEVSNQIGSLIISANAEASGIVARAKLKACAVSNRMIEETKDSLTELGDKYTKEVTNKTLELTDALKVLAEKAESFKKETDNTLKNDCIAIRDTLEAIRNNDKCTEDENE